MSVLSEILAAKRTEVDCAAKRRPRNELEARIADLPRPRDFHDALTSGVRPALIAEVKKASPSKGIIRADFDPVEIARAYAAGGAACISVLTDEPFFQGRLEYLKAIRNAVEVPLLRKDFIIDEYQVLESRTAGADAILLIAAALTFTELERLIETTLALGMAAILEIHDSDELDLALSTSARIIGINNRDLHTFRTSLAVTENLAARIPPDRTIVSESGINTRADVERLAVAGVHAILVGESLMRESDIASKLQELVTPLTPAVIGA
jgi:indole-3-glycerol phosphate synthase